MYSNTSNIVMKKKDCVKNFFFFTRNFCWAKLENKYKLYEKDDDDEIRHHGGEAYINLMHQRVSSNHHNRGWLKRNRKILNFCHKFCFIFVILSGFLVLLTLAWLHFSLRAQTQDLNAQLHQGALKKFLLQFLMIVHSVLFSRVFCF